jgi:hypothetical protein
MAITNAHRPKHTARRSRGKAVGRRFSLVLYADKSVKAQAPNVSRGVLSRSAWRNRSCAPIDSKADSYDCLWAVLVRQPCLGRYQISVTGLCA